MTQSLDKPDCCIDDYEKLPFDDYHKWLEENSDIPNLEVNEDGHLVEVHETDGKKKQSYYDQWGQEIPAGMTYAEYFNIPFWDHRCWYKHPWAGDNFCGCCQRESSLFIQEEARHTNTMAVKVLEVEVVPVVEAALAEVAEKTQVVAASIGTLSE